MKIAWGNHFREVLQIFFPNFCLACGHSLSFEQEFICIECLHTLPFTHYWNIRDNAMEKHLWGRFAFERAVALFHFEKSSGVQSLLHELKYRNEKELGVFLGQMLAEKWKHSLEDKFDWVIPVPLHPQKERARGYNQSMQFAQGLAQVFGCMASSEFLIRTQPTESQTRKNLFQRLDNVSSVFALQQADVLENKHVLLVDDVLTTGATIEACAVQLNKVSNLKLSIATIAAA
jgi:ComF family protein